MGQLSVRLAVCGIGVQNDQPRISQAPQDIPFRSGDVGLGDPLAGRETWAGPVSADQLQQYPVEDPGRVRGEPGSASSATRSSAP